MKQKKTEKSNKKKELFNLLLSTTGKQYIAFFIHVKKLSFLEYVYTSNKADTK